MPICSNCAQLVETGRIICPYCYEPLQSTTPPSRRLIPLITLAVLLAALVGLIRVLIEVWLR
jgi:predicted amidophosphoribosyltransferase